MLLVDHSLETPQSNLAFEDAIIESAEPNDGVAADVGRANANNRECLASDPIGFELLRLWEMPTVCVIMGRGSKKDEVNQSACEADRVPILQRRSGGASVVVGPGCLMYSLLLSLEKRPALRSIDTAHRWVMQRVEQAVASIVPGVRMQGTCDLTRHDRKFSGNALRYKREWLLYHGTLLVQFPLPLISRYLQMPPRQPEYRQSRSHADFLTNLDCDMKLLKQSLSRTWMAEEPWLSHPRAMKLVEISKKIMETKYG